MELTGLFHKHEFTIAPSENCLDLANPESWGYIPSTGATHYPRCSTKQHSGQQHLSCQSRIQSHLQTSKWSWIVLVFASKTYTKTETLRSISTPNLALEFD